MFKAGEAQDDYGSDGGSLSAGNFGAAAHGADPTVFGAGGLGGGGVLQGLGSSGGHRRTPLASLECPSSPGAICLPCPLPCPRSDASVQGEPLHLHPPPPSTHTLRSR